MNTREDTLKVTVVHANVSMLACESVGFVFLNTLCVI